MSLSGIIKVGKHGSSVKFNNIETFRAVTYNDIVKLSNLHQSTFCVLEEVESKDLDKLSDVLSKINIDKSNVYFYNSENTLETYKNYSSLRELQKDITFKFNINVRTYITGAKEEDTAHQEELQRIAEEKARKEQAEREERERKEREAREKEEAERKAREEAERKAREEAERLEAERKAKEEAERLVREEAERKEREEQERLAREEAERKEKENTEQNTDAQMFMDDAEKEEQERLAREEAERKAKEEAERLEREEQARKEQAEQERKAKEEQERLEAERKAKEEAERKAKEEAERLEREEQKRKEHAEREEQERKEKEEAERKAREEAEQLEKDRAAAEKAEQERREKESNELDAALNVNIDQTAINENSLSEDNKETEQKIVKLEITPKLTIWNEEQTENTENENNNSSSENKELIDELNTKNKSLSLADERINKLVQIKDALKDKIDFYEKLIGQVETTQEVIDITSKDNQETLDELEEKKTEIRKLNSEIKNLNENLNELDKIRANLDESNKRVEELEEALNKANTDDSKYKEIKSELNIERESRNEINKLLNKLVDEYSSLNDEHKSLSESYESLKQTNINLTKSISDLNEKLKDAREESERQAKASSDRDSLLRQRLDEYNNKLIDSSKQITEANSLKQQALNEANNAKIEANKYKSELENAKVQLSTAQLDLQNERNQNGALQEKLKRYDAIDIEKLQRDAQVNGLSTTNMAQEIGRVKQELQAAQYQIKLKTTKISELEEANNKLSLTNQSLSNNRETLADMTLQCNYTGRALIIPVFALPSCGSTTAAVSIAKKLTGNVLLMDLDMVNPSLDKWMGMNPMIKDLTELNNLDQTSFGALVRMGSDFFINNSNRVIRKAFTSRNGKSSVYYFSGLYGRVDLGSLAAIDFQQLLNFLGNEYDYIVVDLGRLGGHSFTNSMIKMFNTISWKNVMLTNNDKFSFRVALIKSRPLITNNKTVWLLTMSNTSKVDPLITKNLANTIYKVIQFNSDAYGELMTYSEMDMHNKDTIQQVVELISN